MLPGIFISTLIPLTATILFYPTKVQRSNIQFPLLQMSETEGTSEDGFLEVLGKVGT